MAKYRKITQTFKFVCIGCGKEEIRLDTKRNRRSKCCSNKCAANLPERRTLQAKLASTHLGAKRSNEAKLRMSLAQEKRQRSESEKQRLRTLTIGTIPWNKGLTKNINSSILKISQDVSAYNLKYNRNPGGWNKGLTKENNASLKQMSVSLKKYYNEHPEIREKQRTTAIKLREKLGIGASPTTIELALYSALSDLNIPFEKEVGFKNWVADIFVPSEQIFIMADGDYWHNPNIFENKEKSDSLFNKMAEENGYTVLRFSENNIKKELGKIKTQLCSIFNKEEEL